MNAQVQKQQQGGKKPKTAISPTREENFPEWYQQVVKAADMAENSPTRGCMVIKPYGYALWENIQRALDDMIKDVGVQNAYFPLLIPMEFISREAEHVDGFAKECAVVTHHRLEKGPDGGLIPAEAAKLEQPYIIRPTSETIIGDSMSRWIQSYRDLPLKLNQWCNVMRWEMRTRMFLRTSEFLWQEGHNAFGSAPEAEQDARKMLEVYKKLYVYYLAMPGIDGVKTVDERFPGAVNSYTYEAMMQDGKALQACTSHDLGQNFAKSFDISYQGEDGQVHHAYTTSWGFSTRSVGGMIMSHSDDDGLMVPPRIAPHQVTIIPVVRDESAADVMQYCQTLAERLREKGVRVHFDDSDARTPDKMWSSIKKGIPLRVEAGQREMEEGMVTHTRRDLGRDSKTTCSIDEFVNTVDNILEDIHEGMYKRADHFLNDNTYQMASLDDAREFFASGKVGFVKMDSSILDTEEYEQLKKDHSVSSRCLPFADDGQKVVIGKSY